MEIYIVWAIVGIGVMLALIGIYLFVCMINNVSDGNGEDDGGCAAESNSIIGGVV